MREPVQTGNFSPWKLRYRAPSIRASQIADQAPARGLVVSTHSGSVQYFAWNVPTGELRQLTERPGGMPGIPVLSPDGRYFYYLDDHKGSEMGHYVRASYDTPEREPLDLTPLMPPYSSRMPYVPNFGLSRSGNRLGFLAVDDQGFHVFVMDVGPNDELGPAREIYRSEVPAGGPLFSASGDIAVVMTSARTAKRSFDLVAFDCASGEKLNELSDGGGSIIEMMLTSPLPNDPRLVASTNRSGIETLLIWNPRSGERTDLALEGATGAARAFDWSPDGKSIVLRTINKAVQQLFLYVIESGVTSRLSCPPGTHSPYFAPEGGEIISHWRDASTPTQVIALDAVSGAKKHVLLKAGEVPPGRPLKSVSFNSSDGQEIQGWLGTPDGDGPFPLIFEMHGGPHLVVTDTFAPNAQAWLDHGYAFFSLNYRGSTTFGKAFEEQIIGNLGQWELEDMIAARDYLVNGGIARPDAILLTGWSYGGYLTLLALGKKPGLWAGGMAGIAMADFFAQYQDSSEFQRRWQRVMLGGSPEEKPELYAQCSPITYAEHVDAPILIIQGRHDTRTPPRPVELYEARLKSLGKSIEVHWYDAGHGGSSSDVELGLRHQELMMQFAYRVLGQKKAP
ncbi:MAG: S9 family peptidase [Burkholderiales bacterium]